MGYMSPTAYIYVKLSMWPTSQGLALTYMGQSQKMPTGLKIPHKIKHIGPKLQQKLHGLGPGPTHGPVCVRGP